MNLKTKQHLSCRKLTILSSSKSVGCIARDAPLIDHFIWLTIRCVWLILLSALLTSCIPAVSSPAAQPSATTLPEIPGLTRDQVATLSSLEQLDDYPLYTMHYVGAYPSPYLALTISGLATTRNPSIPGSCQVGWGCSLFAALGDPANRLYGRNFDWNFSPALLLFTDPADGYASVSMVDIEYLGFAGNKSKDLTRLSIIQRQALLQAYALPFDGMNERGLAIGMAAVPPGYMVPDPAKKTISDMEVMREILDHAGTVDEALNILGKYNIDMSQVPLHYLVASATGESALVEFYQGKMVVIRNEKPYQQATNFLVASTNGYPFGECWRYDRMELYLETTKGSFTIDDAFSLLADVAQTPPQAQSPTQWSIVYDITSGKVNIVMGRKYDGAIHTLRLSSSS